MGPYSGSTGFTVSIPHITNSPLTVERELACNICCLHAEFTIRGFFVMTLYIHTYNTTAVA